MKTALYEKGDGIPNYRYIQYRVKDKPSNNSI